MAKIIVKAPFYKPGHKTEKGQSRGGYAQYVGTREGRPVKRIFPVFRSVNLENSEFPFPCQRIIMVNGVCYKVTR